MMIPSMLFLPAHEFTGTPVLEQANFFSHDVKTLVLNKRCVRIFKRKRLLNFAGICHFLATVRPL
jgi:hypothetical protein